MTSENKQFQTLAEPVTLLIDSYSLECQVHCFFNHAGVCALLKCKPPTIDKYKPNSL